MSKTEIRLTAGLLEIRFVRRSELNFLCWWHFYKSDKLLIDHELPTIGEYKANRTSDHIEKEPHFWLTRSKSKKKMFVFSLLLNQCKKNFLFEKQQLLTVYFFFCFTTNNTHIALETRVFIIIVRTFVFFIIRRIWITVSFSRRFIVRGHLSLAISDKTNNFESETLKTKEKLKGY